MCSNFNPQFSVISTRLLLAHYQMESTRMCSMSPTRPQLTNTPKNWQRSMFCLMLRAGFHTEQLWIQPKKFGIDVWMLMLHRCFECVKHSFPPCSPIMEVPLLIWARLHRHERYGFTVRMSSTRVFEVANF